MIELLVIVGLIVFAVLLVRWANRVRERYEHDRATSEKAAYEAAIREELRAFLEATPTDTRSRHYQNHRGPDGLWVSYESLGDGTLDGAAYGLYGAWHRHYWNGTLGDREAASAANYIRQMARSGAAESETIPFGVNALRYICYRSPDGAYHALRQTVADGNR